MGARLSKAGVLVVITSLVLLFQNCAPYSTQTESEQGASNLVAEISATQLKVSLATQSHKKRRPRTLLVQENELAEMSRKEVLHSLKKEYGLQLKRSIVKGKVQQLEIQKMPMNMTEEDVAMVLIDSGAVKFAEPDYQMNPSLAPNDPSLGSQWYHTKVGSRLAWDQTVGDFAIKVTVCDSGIDANHPDLRANILLPGLNTADGSTNTAPISSHGTWVAGVIGAQGNNALGIAGVNWNVTILPGRITNASDAYAYWSDTAECISWGGDNGSKIVNLSYTAGGSSTIDSAAQYLRSKGGLLFVCAGNDNTLLSYPDFTSFMLIGATDANDNKASFSNYGTAIDLAAPGTSMLSTAPGGGYQTVQGTSFATPLVAGAAALILSKYRNLTPAQLESVLRRSALDLGTVGEDNTFGSGRLQIDRAMVLAAEEAMAPSPTPTPTPAPTATATPTPVPAQTVSVASITFKVTKKKNGVSNIQGIVTVKNSNGQLVQGAGVSIQWTGLVSGTATGTTNSNGQVVFSVNTARNAVGSATLGVVSISGSGMTYLPSNNVETSDTVNVP